MPRVTLQSMQYFCALTSIFFFLKLHIFVFCHYFSLFLIFVFREVLQSKRFHYMSTCEEMTLASGRPPIQPLSHSPSSWGHAGAEKWWKSLWTEIKTGKLLTSYCQAITYRFVTWRKLIFCQLKELWFFWETKSKTEGTSYPHILSHFIPDSSFSEWEVWWVHNSSSPSSSHCSLAPPWASSMGCRFMLCLGGPHYSPLSLNSAFTPLLHPFFPLPLPA